MVKKSFKVPRMGKFHLTHLHKLGLVFVAAAIFVYILKTQTRLLEGATDMEGAKEEESDKGGAAMNGDAAHKVGAKAKNGEHKAPTKPSATPTPKAKDGFGGMKKKY